MMCIFFSWSALMWLLLCRFTMLHILRKKMRISIIFIFLANLNKSLALCHAFRKVYLIPHGSTKHFDF